MRLLVRLSIKCSRAFMHVCIEKLGPLVGCYPSLTHRQQNRAVLVGIWWNWVSIGRYWLVLGGTGSVEGGTRLV